MNVTSNAASFFQTTDAINKAAQIEEKKKNKAGNPQTLPLPSKILAVAKDPSQSGVIFIAESAATVRRVQIRDQDGLPIPAKVLKTYRGPTAPLTSLALTNKYVCAGCWDKSIWVWDLASGSSRRFEGGHTDFVKCLLYIPQRLPLPDGKQASNKEFLISGGADAALIIWDLESGRVLFKTKGNQTRSILDLAAYPFAASMEGLPIYLATSINVVQKYNLTFDPPSLQFLEETEEQQKQSTLTHHSSSVFAVHVTEDGDIWSASADKTAQRCSAEQNFKSDTTLDHPDSVSAVLSYKNLVVTGSRDGDVRIWDSASEKLVYSYVGHWDEVSNLVVLDEEKGDLVSVSLDGSIRSWGLSMAAIEKAKEEAAKPAEVKVEKKKESLLTAEEEAELAELMDSDDE